MKGQSQQKDAYLVRCLIWYITESIDLYFDFGHLLCMMTHCALHNVFGNTTSADFKLFYVAIRSNFKVYSICLLHVMYMWTLVRRKKCVCYIIINWNAVSSDSRNNYLTIVRISDLLSHSYLRFLLQRLYFHFVTEYLDFWMSIDPVVCNSLRC